MGYMTGGCRIRYSPSMAGWSMVADEDTAAFSKTPTKSPEEGVNNSDSTPSALETIEELVSLFRRLLESFLSEFCSPGSFRPLPPMIGRNKPADLFNLFVNVSHRGGFDSVSENSLWDEVGQEFGLGLSDSSASLKLIYVKYLDAFARWLNRVIAADDTSSLELSGISDDLVVRLKDFLSEVKRKYELSKGEAAMELGAEFKWFISETKRRYDRNRIRKRKRECSLEALKWLSKAAKDPYDPCIGPLPDRSKWESYGSEEPWKLLLQFRASRTTNDPACAKTWQKLQKMHPSMYEDSTGPGYNLRVRLGSDGSASFSSDEEDRPCPRVSSRFQAEIPEWTGIIQESDSKWLGTQIWPLSKEQNNNNSLLIERDPIGKGRQDSCGCQNPGTIKCVRLHISAKQEKLKLELGSAFYVWCFHTMGEGTLQCWKNLELKKVKSLMEFPPTLSQAFFDRLKNILPSKSRRDIVSYFYNVTLLQFRANQNRITPYEADSDTDPAPEPFARGR